jgi:outer membrane protein assembly factor BamE (lipoprotein component of BamABCDE complex)
MFKIKKLHPSYYGLVLFVVIIFAFVVYANLGTKDAFLRDLALCLFPMMLILGIVGFMKAKKMMQYSVSVFCILIAGLVSFALQNVLIYGYTPTDSIFSVLQNRNTIWVEGYSKKQCSLVEVGMAEDEVLLLLGEPLVVENRKSGINWFYTSGPEGKVQGRVHGSTHVRRVLFKAS